MPCNALACYPQKIPTSCVSFLEETTTVMPGINRLLKINSWMLLSFSSLGQWAEWVCKCPWVKWSWKSWNFTLSFLAAVSLSGVLPTLLYCYGTHVYNTCEFLRGFNVTLHFLCPWIKGTRDIHISSGSQRGVFKVHSHVVCGFRYNDGSHKPLQMFGRWDVQE